MLWVSLQLQRICMEDDDYSMLEVLKTLPKTLQTTYQVILSRIASKLRLGSGSNSEQSVIRQFQWILGAKRPLSVHELREAIVIEHGQRSRQTNKYINTVEKLVSRVHGLVYLDEVDDTVNFVHHTIKDFLSRESELQDLKRFLICYEATDLVLGIGCLTYLNCSDLRGGIVKRQRSTFWAGDKIVGATVEATASNAVLRTGARLAGFSPSLVSNVNIYRTLGGVSQQDGVEDIDLAPEPFHFLTYARDWWLAHCDGISESDKFSWSILDSILSGTNTLARLPWTSKDWREGTDGFFGWVYQHPRTPVPKVYIQQNVNISSQSKARLLNAAVQHDDLDLVNVVLANDFNSQGGVFDAFKRALSYRALGVSERLVLEISDPDFESKTFPTRSCLALAAEAGFTDIIQKLLSLGADPNFEEQMHKEPLALQQAAKWGHLDIVNILIDRGADVDHLPGDMREPYSALQLAAQKGHTKIVEQLLKAHASVNLAGIHFSMTVLVDTPLQMASENGHLHVVNRLIAAGADVNAQPSTERRMTALQAATSHGYRAVVERLILAGANVNAREPRTFTALQFACENDDIEIADRLLSEGADVSAPPPLQGGPTALASATANNNVELIELLLAHDTARATLQANRGSEAGQELERNDTSDGLQQADQATGGQDPEAM